MAAMSDTRFGWNLFVNILVAVGTLGTVVVALFGTAIKNKWWSPIFEASLPDPRGQKTPVKDDKGNSGTTRYYHLRISNTRRWSNATGAALYLVRIDEPGPNGEFQMKWTGDLPVSCRHQNFYPLARDIGSPIDYDLCSIAKEDSRLELHPIILGYDIELVRRGHQKLIAWFQVKCLECESPIIKVRVSWDGKWDDGEAEMAAHFDLTLLGA
jgi:hypothetical protein